MMRSVWLVDLAEPTPTGTRIYFGYRSFHLSQRLARLGPFYLTAYGRRSIHAESCRGGLVIGSGWVDGVAQGVGAGRELGGIRSCWVVFSAAMMRVRIGGRMIG
jgi:hypothetical protein